MGAAQSKKKRKERRRRKKIQMESSSFDMPRSASLDAIRTHGLSFASCPHCQNWRSNTLGANTLLGATCSRHLRHPLTEDADDADGYQSCPSYSNSNCCLAIVNPGPSSGATDTERSTMSLNRNFTTHHSKLAQSKSSEFVELLDFLKKYENRKKELSLMLQPSPEPTLSIEETRSLTHNGPAPPTIRITNDLTEPSETLSHKEVTTKLKRPITLLEDEESRLARWQKHKHMAQQLRALRKHIKLQENSRQKHPAPFDLSVPFKEPNDQTSDPEVLAVLEPSSKQAHRSQRSKFSRFGNYRYLDNHPVLSKLQNEQNNRLESMERRMKEIRLSAMQEAERRKFAEIFPAKPDTSRTDRMLQEAKEMLEKLKADKKKREEEAQSNTVRTNADNIPELGSRSESDSGDVIPVLIYSHTAERPANHTAVAKSSVEQQTAPKAEDKETKQPEVKKKIDWLNNAWPNINLDHPITWLILPFLVFPMILRMLLCLIINTGGSTGQGTTDNIGHRDMKPKR